AVLAGDHLAVAHVDGDGRGAFIAVRITDGVDESVGGAGRRHAVGGGVVDRIALGIQGEVAVLTHHLGIELARGGGRSIVASTHADHVFPITDHIRTDYVVVEHVAGYG